MAEDKGGAGDGGRRGMLKAALAAGASLAFAGVARESRASGVLIRPEDRPEAARAHFLDSMNCSRAIVETYAPAFGLDAEVAGKLAAGFAGGMGAGSVCGAVTAAYMVLGLANGPRTASVWAGIEEFNREFTGAHGNVGCSELLKVDMSTREGFRAAERSGCFTSVCPGYVKTACDILERMTA